MRVSGGNSTDEIVLGGAEVNAAQVRALSFVVAPENDGHIGRLSRRHGRGLAGAVVVGDRQPRCRRLDASQRAYRCRGSVGAGAATTGVRVDVLRAAVIAVLIGQTGIRVGA